MADQRVKGVSGVVMAGGESRRMGRDKALIAWRGRPLILYSLDVLEGIFEEVIISCRQAAKYRHLGFPVREDRFPGRGALVGLYSGLSASREPLSFFAACDMPRIRPELVRLIVGRARPGDAAVVPVSPRGIEPLLALYSRECLPVMEELLGAGELRIRSLLERIPVRFLDEGEVAAVDPDFLSFTNINSPAELERIGAGGGALLG